MNEKAYSSTSKTGNANLDNEMMVSIQESNLAYEAQQIFNAIFNQKKLILLVIFLTTSLAFCFWLITYNWNKVVFNIQPLPNTQVNSYAQLNTRSKAILPEISEINSTLLLELFLDKLRSREVIIKTLNETNFLEKRTYDDFNSYNIAVEKFAYEMIIVAPESDAQRPSSRFTSNWSLVFDSKGEKETLEFLSYLVGEINKSIKADEIEKYAQLITDHLLKYVELKQDLNTRYDNLISDHGDETNRLIARLNQDIILAKSLNLENNVLDFQFFNNKTNIVPLTSVDTNQQSQEYSIIVNEPPAYLRGYKSLSEEIKLAERRKDDINFIDGIAGLNKQLRSIEQDKRVERFNSTFEKSPLNNEQFQAINFHLGSIDIKPRFKPWILLLGGIFLGLFLGVILAIAKTWKNISAA